MRVEEDPLYKKATAAFLRGTARLCNGVGQAPRPHQVGHAWLHVTVPAFAAVLACMMTHTCPHDMHSMHTISHMVMPRSWVGPVIHLRRILMFIMFSGNSCCFDAYLHDV